jgi:hypothetical protein
VAVDDDDGIAISATGFAAGSDTARRANSGRTETPLAQADGDGNNDGGESDRQDAVDERIDEAYDGRDSDATSTASEDNDDGDDDYAASSGPKRTSKSFLSEHTGAASATSTSTTHYSERQAATSPKDVRPLAASVQTGLPSSVSQAAPVDVCGMALSGGPVKVVVFSYFTTMLDLIGTRSSHIVHYLLIHITLYCRARNEGGAALVCALRW